jgi:hypothetical protein
MTNNEHAITLTDAELDEVVGGLNPQPLPPGASAGAEPLDLQ